MPSSFMYLTPYCIYLTPHFTNPHTRYDYKTYIMNPQGISITAETDTLHFSRRLSREANGHTVGMRVQLFRIVVVE